MRKILFFIALCLVVVPSSWAQQLEGSVETSQGQKFFVQATGEDSAPEGTQDSTKTGDEQEQTEEENVLPTTITPEQKAEINIQAKKQTRGIIRTQKPRDRRSFLDALQMLDKKAARQQAMAEGKTDKEVEEAGATVKEPDVDPLNDKAMEEYMFEKVDVNERIITADEQ